MSTVPYTFANSVGNIPLAYLDANFSNVKASANTAGTVTTASQPNITSVGTLTSLTVTGNVTAANFTGNITGNISNAVYAETAGTVSTAAQPNITSVGTLNVLTTSGNIRTTGGAFVGSGAGLTNIPGANVTNTVANATYATSAGSATTAGTVTTAAQPNITSVGTLSSLTVTGNITSSTGVISGNAAGLTNLVGANVTGTVANASYATSAATAGTVTTNAQPNITSVGTLSSLAVTANVDAGNLVMGFGSKFYCDFSSPIGNGRTVFQTSNSSGAGFTSITAVPGDNNILATASAFTAYLLTDVANSSWFAIQQANTEARITSNKNGGGSYLPITIYTSNTEQIRVDVNGNVGIGNSSPADKLSVTGNAYVSGNIISSTVSTTPVALSSLTAVAGARSFINDGNLVASGNFGAQVSGGGANTVPVWSNGTNWYIG